LVWEAELTNTFVRSYGHLSEAARVRVDEAMEQLLESEDPRRLGLRKVGKWKGAYSYEIGRQFRILYSFRLEARTVIFLDVGTHGVYR
jgi:mRNA-degrading endonuclease RelE of RelBE toxin-antitoxin system